jgi:hypothetical protein
MAPSFTPGQFCRLALHALDHTEARSRRRKRDQTPDAYGLGIKRDLLRRGAEADPPAEHFEAWLLEQALETPVSGPVRAMCVEILQEYRAAHTIPGLGEWLLSGAPGAADESA